MFRLESRLTAGRHPVAPGELVVDQRIALAWDVTIGDHLVPTDAVGHESSPGNYTVVGFHQEPVFSSDGGAYTAYGTYTSAEFRPPIAALTAEASSFPPCRTIHTTRYVRLLSPKNADEIGREIASLIGVPSSRVEYNEHLLALTGKQRESGCEPRCCAFARGRHRDDPCGRWIGCSQRVCPGHDGTTSRRRVVALFGSHTCHGPAFGVSRSTRPIGDRCSRWFGRWNRRDAVGSPGSGARFRITRFWLTFRLW